LQKKKKDRATKYSNREGFGRVQRKSDVLWNSGALGFLSTKDENKEENCENLQIKVKGMPPPGGGEKT